MGEFFGGLGRFVSVILGLGLLGVAVYLGIWLKWGHVDMTVRRLWIEFPWHNAAALLCSMCGLIFLQIGGLNVFKK